MSLSNKPDFSWEAMSSIKFWLRISAVFGITTLVPSNTSRSVRRSLLMVLYCCVFNTIYFCAVVYLPGPPTRGPGMGYFLSIGIVLTYAVSGRGVCLTCNLMTRYLKSFLNRMLKTAARFPPPFHRVSVVYIAMCGCWRLLYCVVYNLKNPNHYYAIVGVLVLVDVMAIAIIEMLFVACQMLLFSCVSDMNNKLSQICRRTKNPIFNICSPKKEEVRSLRRLHNELCDAAGDLNLAQGPGIVIITAFNLFLITSTLYQETKHELILATVLGRAASLSKIFWHLTTLTILVWCNTITTHKANETVDLVHKLLYETRSPMIRKELEIFSLQLLQRKIHFTAFGLFPLDFTLLYSMLGAVTAYLVILIQFQQVFEARARA